MIPYSPGILWGVFSPRTWYFMVRMEFFRSAASVALLASASAGAIKYYDRYIHPGFLLNFMPDQKLFAAFTFFVTFLVVFRTNYALRRFTDACIFALQFTGVWFNACSSLFSFCRGTTADKALVKNFLHTLIR